MKPFSNKLRAIAGAAALIGAAQLASAAVITDPSGLFSVGIDAGTGALYDGGTGVGIRRISDGYDPLSPGTPRDSWGLSYGGAVAYGDPFFFGSVNQSVSSSIFGANSATVVNDIGGGAISLTQQYSFIAPNVLKISEKITNTSGSAQAIRFQRDVDWDILPTLFFETTNVPAGPPAQVSEASYNGFESPSPLVAYFSNALPGGGTFGPSDLGGGIKLDLGILGDGDSIAFDYFYAISELRQGAAGLGTQLAGLGIDYFLLSGSGDGGTNGAAIGVSVGVPEPASIALIGLGLAGLGAVRRGKARARN